MEPADDIFSAKDPFVLTQAWMDAARSSEPSDADAVALASVDSDGLPNVRMVLLRGLEPDAFVFFTNYESRKAEEILTSGKAAFVLHWKSLKRQIRVRGLAKKEDGEVADRYYDSRALGSRIGAWASQQSRPLANREQLMEDVRREEARHGGGPLRPPFWGGIRIRPLEIEFWAEGAFRLHDRFRWSRSATDESWCVKRLYP